jgi:transposase
MRHIEFTEEEIKQLAHDSVYHERPIVRRRMQALLLKSQGLLHQEIVKTLDISPTTLRNYFDLFLEGRVEALKRLGYKGKRNLLMERKDEIIVNLEANPPATYKEAQVKIQTVTGLKRSLPQVREFLKKTGLRAAK